MGTPEDTLARVNETLSNSLGPAPPPDPRIEALRGQIVTILRSDPCGRINFTLGNLYVAGLKYRYVADLLANRKIGIDVDPALTGKGLAGRYNPLFDRLVFPWAALDGNNGDGKRGTIVHECTHASFDVSRSGITTRSLDDEAAAFIAECVYLINAGRSYPQNNNDFTKSVYAMASKIVASNRNGDVGRADPAGVAFIKPMLASSYADAPQNYNGVPYR